MISYINRNFMLRNSESCLELYLIDLFKINDYDENNLIEYRENYKLICKYQYINTIFNQIKAHYIIHINNIASKLF